MEITLRAPGTPIDALTLDEGLHPIGRALNGGLCRVDASGEARVWIRVDRCGTWLAVVDGVRGVHVNGRPVRRCALLRAGDSVHVDGMEIVLTAPVAAAAAAGAAIAPGPELPGAEGGDPRMVLRGIGGRHHGRSYTLGTVRTLGGGAEADIGLDGAGVPARRVRIGREGAQLVLRAAGDAAPVTVNGVPTREAVLRAGDQLAFETGQRFVVEAPLPAAATPVPAPGTEAPEGPRPDALRPTARRLPLLLVAALLLAAALSALLLL